MKKMNGQIYYTIKETAEFLQVSDKTIRRYIDKGILKATKFGNPKLIRKKDIDKLIEPQ